jgi:HK97 gp10 family phage protein
MRWRGVTAKLEGFAALDKALGQLPKATAKNVLRRVLRRAAQPIDDDASAAAPVNTGKLQVSVITGTQLTRSQRRGAMLKTSNYYAEIHVGTSLGRGMFQEFGTFKDAPQPWFRPAWEANKDQALNIIKVELGGEIEKAAKRYAKKLAKGA